jgi:Superinfection immunity protein
MNQQRPSVGWLLAGLLMLGAVVALGTLPPAAGGAVSLVLAIYFLPCLVAWWRRSPNGLAIFVMNLFLGWTFIGWVVALVWACAAIRKD